ncbi:MAG TPA: hypothetical protein VE988_15825 [Gemmataceae bacterium]|nr:hypothetical protein [Gemmataceae bacterium]
MSFHSWHRRFASILEQNRFLLDWTQSVANTHTLNVASVHDNRRLSLSSNLDITAGSDDGQT